MADYPTYAIYTASVRYTRELMDYDLRNAAWVERDTKGLPRFRIRDRTHWYGWMYREDPGEDEVRIRLQQVWEEYVAHPDAARSPDYVPRNPGDVEFHVGPVEYEEWCLTWFCHQTFDIGQTDDEVLRSFSRFLARKGVHGGDHEYGDGKYCAMGAEDRWRWHGETHDDPPPCRCDGCKKAGMVRIGH